MKVIIRLCCRFTIPFVSSLAMMPASCSLVAADDLRDETVKEAIRLSVDSCTLNRKEIPEAFDAVQLRP
jgi:hypothetical protein